MDDQFVMELGQFYERYAWPVTVDQPAQKQKQKPIKSVKMEKQESFELFYQKGLRNI